MSGVQCTDGIGYRVSGVQCTYGIGYRVSGVQCTYAIGYRDEVRRVGQKHRETSREAA